MTQQEIIERDVRITLGDMHLQLIMARARIQELEQQAAQEQAPVPDGRYEESRVNGQGQPN